jgi:hypothetical protein
MSNESIENRKKMVLAMELLARSVADEELIDAWLRNGVADGDIEPFSLDIDEVDDCYIDDKSLYQLITCFLTIMIVAKGDGGLDLP